MFRVFPDLLAALQAVLPPWALPIVGILVVAALTPAWLYWSRSKQIRGQLRRVGRAQTEADKQAARDAAFALAEKHPRLMVALADETEKLGMRTLLARALDHLEEHNSAPEDAKRLRAKTTREIPPPLHPLEEAVHVERMLGEGMTGAAEARLDRALARFPDDEELLDLKARLHEPRPAAPEDPQAP